MKRTTGAMVLLAALTGCVSTDGDGGGGGQYMGHVWNQQGAGCGPGCMAGAPPSAPGFVGPGGAPVALAAPYNVAPAGGADVARNVLRQSVPLDLVQQAGLSGDPRMGMPIQRAQFCPPGGCPPGGGMPPGMMPPGLPGMGGYPPGAVAAVGALTGGGAGPFTSSRSEVRFTGPNGLRIAWFAPTPDGKAGFGPQYLEAPGKYNFSQGAIYRLKLTDIPNRPGIELYPTLEVVPANARTATFLAHSAVPINFTEEDFDQVTTGNYLVKVVYLPDPQFQDLAATGTEEVISSRLEPGADPIAEAHRRGNILLVIRMGNIDLEAPNTPAMDAPNPYQARPPMGPAGMPPGMPPGLGARMVPYPGILSPPGMPPGAMPPGMMPPGMMPPGMMPPGMMPPQGMPPGGLPPSVRPGGGMLPPPQPAPGDGAPPVAAPPPGAAAPPADGKAAPDKPSAVAPARRTGLLSWFGGSPAAAPAPAVATK